MGAPGLRPRVGCSGLSLAAPKPRFPAWSLHSEQVSAAAGASPAGAPSPGVARTFPTPQTGMLRPRGDSAPGAYFRGRFSWVVLSVLLSCGGDGGRLLRMRGRAGVSREEGEPTGQGASSPQPFGTKILGICSQPAVGCLAFLVCEMKAPTSLIAETLTSPPHCYDPMPWTWGSNDLGQATSGLCSLIPYQ